LSSLDIIIEIDNALKGIPGITEIYDLKAHKDAVCPYIVVDQIRRHEGRLMDDTERKSFIDIHLWTDPSFVGKKKCCEFEALIEAKMKTLSRDYFLDESVFIIDEESSMPHLVMTFRTYDNI